MDTQRQTPRSDVEVRPFARSDRQQLTDLVNAHVQAVIPGLTVSVNRVLSQLEREPDEFIVDRWVAGRTTVVAEQRGRVVAAAHLIRYGSSADVGETYRDAGEIRWLVCWPDAPFWPNAHDGGDAIAASSIAYLRGSGATSIHADGALPAPGIFGIPDQWPHVRDILRRAGFVPGGRTEGVFFAEVAALKAQAPTGLGLRTRRTVGVNGTRLSAITDDHTAGYVEVDIRRGDSGLTAGHDGWADVGNLWVDPPFRRRGVGRWLLGEAAAWLSCGHVDRLLDYASPQDTPYLAFLRATGFVHLTTSTREWTL